MQQKQRNNLKARHSIAVPHMVTIISQILPKKIQNTLGIARKETKKREVV